MFDSEVPAQIMRTGKMFSFRRCFSRGLNREEAADYIRVSPSKFDQLVGDGRMPRAKRIDRRKVWDRNQLDRAFDNLPDSANDDIELEVD